MEWGEQKMFSWFVHKNGFRGTNSFSFGIKRKYLFALVVEDWVYSVQLQHDIYFWHYPSVLVMKSSELLNKEKKWQRFSETPHIIFKRTDATELVHFKL